MSGHPTDHPGQTSHSDLTVTTDEQPLGVADLLGILTDQLTTLLRQEVELAKTEAKQEARTAAKAGVGFGAAGLTAFLATLFVSLGIAWALAEVLPAGVAFLIVGVVYGIVTAVLLATARKKTEKLDPGLPETRDSITNDIDWAKDKP